MPEEHGLRDSLSTRFGQGRTRNGRPFREWSGQGYRLRELFARHGHKTGGLRGQADREKGCRDGSAALHCLQGLLSRRHRDVRWILASSLIVDRREGGWRLWCVYREGRWGRVMAAVLCSRGTRAALKAAARLGCARRLRPVCHVQSEGPFFYDIPQELCDRLTPPWEWPEAAREQESEGLEWYMRVCRFREEAAERSRTQELHPAADTSVRSASTASA